MDEINSDGEGTSPPHCNVPDEERIGTALREVWRVSWPCMLRQFVNTASDRLTLGFVGHYDYADTSHYDGAGVGKMFSNITGLSVGIGVSLGLSTLCSQAFGAGRSRIDSPVYFWRCQALLLVALLFSGAAAACAEAILNAAAQPPDVARTSARYAQVQLVGVPFQWLGMCLSSMLDATQRTKPGLYASAIASMSQVLACWLAVAPLDGYGLGWGYLGMAAARSLAGAIQVLVIVVYIRRHGLQEHVWRLHPEAPRVLTLAGLAAYAAVAMPAAIVCWIEWWAFEGLALLVGTLPDAIVQLAAFGTVFNVLVTWYNLFSGLSQGLCAVVGKHVGSGRPHLARLRVGAAVLLAMPLAVVIAAGLWLGRGAVAAAFTADTEVQSSVRSSMLGASLSVLGYALLMTLYGACRGIARQSTAARATTAGYALGIPLAWFLAKEHSGWPSPLLGVWFGNAAALGIAATCVTTLMLRLDWDGIKLAGSSASCESAKRPRKSSFFDRPRKSSLSVGEAPLLRSAFGDDEDDEDGAVPLLLGE